MYGKPSFHITCRVLDFDIKNLVQKGKYKKKTVMENTKRIDVIIKKAKRLLMDDNN